MNFRGVRAQIGAYIFYNKPGGLIKWDILSELI